MAAPVRDEYGQLVSSTDRNDRLSDHGADMDSACCCGPVAGREERNTVAIGIAEVAGRGGRATSGHAGIAQEIEVAFHIIAEAQREDAGRTDGEEHSLGFHHLVMLPELG